MFECLLRIISNGRDAQTRRVAKGLQLYPGTPPMSLCFMNTRQNFAQRTASLEMLTEGNEGLQYNLCCSSARHSGYEQTDRYPQVRACLIRHFKAR